MSNKELFLLLSSLFSIDSYALPFNIVPKSPLPTQTSASLPATAFYTVSNLTGSQRNNNYVKYLPPHVSQVTSDVSVPDLCSGVFSLAPRNATGDSCTLELSITGAVNSADPSPANHLFVCFPGGVTCAGTKYPLNVTEINTQVAVGGLSNSITHYAAVAGTGDNGATWTLQSLALLPGVTSEQLYGVSCSNGSCAANGINNLNGISHVGIATSSNGGITWTQQTLPLLTDSVMAEGYGIYCNSGLCLSAGFTGTNVDQSVGLIGRSTDAGSTWSQQALPLLTNNVLAALIGVSCTTNTCVSVGASEDIGGVVRALVATSHDDGLTWSQQVLSLPVNILEAELVSVSCVGSSCIGVGEYFDSDDLNYPGIAVSQDSGDTWTQQILTPPNGFTEGELLGIDCTSSYCVAVGDYSTVVNYSAYPAVAVTTDGGTTWNQQALTLPAGYTYGHLSSVQCTGTTCNAAGYFQSTVSGNEVAGIATSTDSGATWTTQILNMPAGYTQAELNGIS